jgi:hypothetical protein
MDIIFSYLGHVRFAIYCRYPALIISIKLLRRKRRWWTRPWIVHRPVSGAYAATIDLRLSGHYLQNLLHSVSCRIIRTANKMYICCLVNSSRCQYRPMANRPTSSRIHISSPIRRRPSRFCRRRLFVVPLFSAGVNNFYSGLVPFFGNRCEATRWAGGQWRVPERVGGGPAGAAADHRPNRLSRKSPCLGHRCRLSRPRQPPSTTNVVRSTYSNSHPCDA